MDYGGADVMDHIFAEDGELLGPGFAIRGREALGGVPAQVAAQYRSTLHMVHNQLVEIDGDQARSVTYCLAHHVIDGGIGFEMAIRYHDLLRRGSEGWRIASRQVLCDWTRRIPVEPFRGFPLAQGS
jgi:hypothetical protein